MRFQVIMTSGSEVAFAGASTRDRPVFYGAEPEAGLWKVSLPKFEDFIASELASQSFGSSVEIYGFGFELAELEEWGQWFKKTRNYVSYRPRQKTIISVGQIEWRRVKDLSVQEQLAHLGEALLLSIENVAHAKRKPKDFHYRAFSDAVRGALAACRADEVSAARE